MHRKDWKKFKSNNKSIALNTLYVSYNAEEIRQAYKSKHNLIRKNQVIILMITDGKKWHYLAVKSFSALLKVITSNHKGDFYCLNCLHLYRTENKLKKHYNVFENYDYYLEMPKEDNKILKYNYGEKSMKVTFIICADLEPLLEKMSTCHNNLKTNKHTAYGYSMFANCSFDATKNKSDCYRRKDCMKNFCTDLGKHTTKMFNYEK